MEHCIPNLDRFEELAKKFKSVKRYQVGDLILFDYVYADSGLFKERCGKDVRGIVFHENGTLVSRPLHKFFNHAESLAPNDFSPWVVGEKIDGSLLQITVNPVTNKIFVASRSSHNPESSYVISAYRRLPEGIRKRMEEIAYEYSEYTHLYEIVDPNNQIVIFYDTLSFRYLISRNKVSGLYSILDETNLGELLNPVRWKPIKSMDELIGRARTEEGIEGWVVYDKSGEDFIKIKTLWYFERHKITTLSLPEHYVAAWAKDDIDDYMSYAELVGGKKADLIRKVKSALDFELKMLLESPVTSRALEISGSSESRKDAALALKDLFSNNDDIYMSVVFPALMGQFERPTSEKISEIAKVYKKMSLRQGSLRKKLVNLVREML